MIEADRHHINTIVDEISSFLQIPKNTARKKVEYEYANPGKSVAKAWNKKPPKTTEEIEGFYKTTDSYIYDLSLESIRPTRIEWRDAILFYLSQFETRESLLDFGGGVGTESIYFANYGYSVTYHDLPGTTHDFAKYRFSLYAPEVLAIDSRESLGVYDAIICLEVLEHLVNPLATINFLYDKLAYGGILFLTESFELVSSDYPSHLQENTKFAKGFEKKLVEIGFSIIDKISNGRIFVLGKFGTVDIVLPTYNAIEHVKQCVNSVKISTEEVPYRFVFVNDASTTPEIKKFFKKEIGERDIYLENDANLGFVKTANRGIQASSENDVVLLNTDTKVTKGWLSAILRSIYKNNNYATANPLSNNSSIYSIDGLSVLEKQLSLNTIGEIVCASSMHIVPEIPVSVGFCMYIKRTALKVVGLLDEIFERGYGEESDFCMRCREEGYAHILVDDAFVYHQGHVSMLAAGYIKSGDTSIDAHEKILHDRYPDYSQIICSFNEQRIMRRIASNINQNITSYMAKSRRKIMYVLHTPINGEKIGGTEFHVRDLKDSLENDFAIYVLYIRDGRHMIVEEYLDGLLSTYYFDIPFAIPKFTLSHPYMYEKYREVLRVFDIDLVHIHHLINHTFDLIYAAKSLSKPVVMTMHDYYSISPDYNLMYRLTPTGYSAFRQPTRKYFEEKFNLHGFSNTKWQEQIGRFLPGINEIIFPSNTVKEEVVSIYPKITRWQVIEHGEGPTTIKESPCLTYQKASKECFSVLFLGYSHAPQKGQSYMNTIISSLLKSNIEVHMLGTSSEHWLDFVNKKNFIIHGLYNRQDIVSILRHINPNLVALPSPWPETFSYTYSEALEANIPVVAYDIGAISERGKLLGGTALVQPVGSKPFSDKVIELSKKTKEYRDIRKQALNVKTKTLAENIEEYRKLYNRFGLNQKKHIDETDSKFDSAKRAAFMLAENYYESEYVRLNEAVEYQHRLIESRHIAEQVIKDSELKLDVLNAELTRQKQFIEKVKKTIPYKTYRLGVDAGRILSKNLKRNSDN